MYINSEIKAIASQELQNEVSAELSQEDQPLKSILEQHGTRDIRNNPTGNQKDVEQIQVQKLRH
jgi:hypothetical protein